MDQVLHGLPGVMCYLDDIFITGATDQKHLSNLATVLERLRVKGFRLKKNKCHFMKTTVEYLGHMIYANGIHTSPKTCQAITEAQHCLDSVKALWHFFVKARVAPFRRNRFKV